VWVLLALVAACGSAGSSLAIKGAVGRGGLLVTTVAFRAVAAALLLALVLAADAWPGTTPAYWRAVALMLPPEIAGMLCMSLALRGGELSLVQPIFGLLPALVTIAGALLLGEVPNAYAAAGIGIDTAGIYAVGLRPGASAAEPLRALARSRASWFALAAVVAWSLATVVHKLGIAAIGPFGWGFTLAAGSALVPALALPLVARRAGSVGVPAAPRDWLRWVALAGLLFAAQQVGLHLALRAAQAGYVMAVSSTSVVLAAVLGVVLLGERAGARSRIAGGLLVSAGAALIAALG
jgi:drug/metabolite transporter (DMT)-like permease